MKCQTCTRHFHKACIQGTCDVCAGKPNTIPSPSTSAKNSMDLGSQEISLNPFQPYRCIILSKRVKRCQACRVGFRHGKEQHMPSRFERKPFDRTGKKGHSSAREISIIICWHIVSAKPTRPKSLVSYSTQFFSDTVRKCPAGEGFAFDWIL